MEVPYHGAPFYGSKDPIAALATPLSESALAIIRTTGSGSDSSTDGRSAGDNQGAGADRNAIQLLAEIFSRPLALLSAPGNSIVHGWIVEPLSGTSGSTGKKIDEVLVSVYRSPRSYTGEDSADISCHGGLTAVKAIMAALKKAGFRQALPGEFTFRAFMNGKLDLTRAESVMELVAAKTGRAREQAVKRLLGVLEKEISDIKSKLMELLAGTEIYLDYSEDEFQTENDESEGRLPDRNLAEEALSRLKTLSELWGRERLYAEGALAVLTGLPNAGKSSLFNYLLREDRSIVTDAPGTTRDWIEALISVEGVPLRLIDTAGLRSTRGLNQKDEAERLGMERSLELLEQAKFVLYVVDGERGFTKEDLEFLSRHKETSQSFLVLWNKADIAKPPEPAVEELPRYLQKVLLPVSAKTGEGISALMFSIAGLLQNASGFPAAVEPNGATGPGSLRQKELIDSALTSIEEVLTLADNNEALDIIAPLIRSAVNALGEITGEVYNADVLEVIFSRFCVGK